MDNNELKDALMSGVPVILTHVDGHEGEYKCVTAIMYRQRKGKIVVTAELLDKNERTVIICDPKKLKIKP